MILIVIVILALWAVLLAWSWNNLGTIEKKQKVIYLGIGILVVFFLSILIYGIAQIGVQYEKVEIKEAIRNMTIPMITAINGMVILPTFYKMLEQIKEKTIQKSEFQRKAILLLGIFFVVVILECNYLRGMQEGILAVIQQMKQQS